MNLNIKERKEKGKEEAKRLRREGKIPGVIYGKGEETKKIWVDRKELTSLLKEVKGKIPIVEIKSNKGKPFRGIIKSLQRRSTTDEILHIDLQRVHPKEIIHMSVPLHLVGTPIGIKKGGIPDQLVREIPVKGKIANIPSYLEIDITNLDLGDSIHIRDLKKEKWEPLLSPDTPLVSILVPRGLEEEEKKEEVPTEGEEKVKEEEEK